MKSKTLWITLIILTVLSIGCGSADSHPPLQTSRLPSPSPTALPPTATPTGAPSETPFPLQSSFEVHSESMDAVYKVYVGLPDTYDPHHPEGYHVIYLLDGDWYFDGSNPRFDEGGVAEIVRLLGAGDRIPDSILVGIGYPGSNERFRDFHGRMGDFHTFLTEELIPRIDDQYPTNIDAPRTLIGHSSGAYFAFYAFCQFDKQGQNPFQQFIAISGDYARMGWDYLFQEEEALHQRVGPGGQIRGSLFMAVGGEDEDRFLDSNQEMAVVVESRNYDGLRFNNRTYTEDDHMSVVAPAIWSGLLWVFGDEPGTSNAAHNPTPSETPLHTNTPKPSKTPTPEIPLDGRGGGLISFHSSRDGDPEIYLMNADGSGLTQITDHPANDESPAISPDGSRLAFASDRDGNWEIYIVDLTPFLWPKPGDQGAGTNPERLTHAETDEFTPSWSPDSTFLAITSGNLNRADLYIVEIVQPETKNWLRLTDNGAEDRLPRWSPLGTQILFQSSMDGNPEIYTIAPDGSALKRLTHNTATDYDPSWSPDGGTITFISMREGDSDLEIYSMGSDGSNQLPLISMVGIEHLPVWSPDGSRIAFLSNRTGDFDIYTINQDGSDRQRLTVKQGWDVLHSWEFAPIEEP